MDFDFNIILVPVTLLLGLIWLLDKLWFKRHGIKAQPSAQYKVAQEKLQAQQALLEGMLADNAIQYDSLDTLVLDDKATRTPVPVEVKRAYTDYREAKRQLNVIKTTDHKPSAPLITRLAYDFFPVLAIVLVVRSFIIEPFNIPSSSMVPTLYTGDFIAVNKYAYGLRLPLTYNKLIDVGSPERGDVAVFRYPDDPKVYFIKRVVGLPGDLVTFDKGILSINGSPIPSQPVEFQVADDVTDYLYTPIQLSDGSWKDGMSPHKAVATAQKEELAAQYFAEQLGDHNYLRRYLHDRTQYGYDSRFSDKLMQNKNGWQVQVPEDSYFVLGDNSDRSGDSRFWGFVPDDNLSGKAVYVWMHKKPGIHMPTFSHNGTID